MATRPDRSRLPGPEEALALERAARAELIRRKLKKLQASPGEQRPRTDKEGAEYLAARFREDGYL